MAADRKPRSSAARKKAEPEIVPLVAHRQGGATEARPWVKRWLDTFLLE